MERGRKNRRWARTFVAGLKEAFEKEVLCGSMRGWDNKINRDVFLDSGFDVEWLMDKFNFAVLVGGHHTNSGQQTRHKIFLPVDPVDKEHKVLEPIDLEVPRFAWYKQKVWKKHQNTVYRVDIKLAQKKGFKFYKTRPKKKGFKFYEHDRTQSSFTTHSQLLVSRRLS